MSGYAPHASLAGDKRKPDCRAGDGMRGGASCFLPRMLELRAAREGRVVPPARDVIACELFPTILPLLLLDFSRRPYGARHSIWRRSQGCAALPLGYFRASLREGPPLSILTDRSARDHSKGFLRRGHPTVLDQMQRVSARFAGTSGSASQRVALAQISQRVRGLAVIAQPASNNPQIGPEYD